MIDPTGEIGDYYDKHGRWLGTDNIDDDKVYLATPVGQQDGRTIYTRHDLGITHTQFQIISNIVRQEGDTNDGEEYLWIAHASNNRARATNTTLFRLLMSGYSSVEDKTGLATTNRSFVANASRASVMHVLLGGSDPTNGAQFWDGTDFLAWGLNSPNGTPHNKFEEYSQITIGRHIYTNYLSAQQSNWGATARYGNKRYNLPADVFRGNANWKTDGKYSVYFQYNTGVRRRPQLTATGTAGRSIFWRID